MTKLLDAALDYAQQGMSVIPLVPKDKKPLLYSWKEFQNKRMGIGDMRGFWKDSPESNIGIVTGAISGITVIDVDGEEGLASLRGAGIKLPDTHIVKTPKGWHFYYKYNNLFKTGAGFLKNVDVRNDAGYVVAPPSKTSDKDYAVLEDNGGVFSEFGVVPEQFLGRQPKTVEPNDKESVEPWVTEALENGAPEGQRDVTATRVAGYFWARGIQEDILQSILVGFGEKCTPPMNENDIARIVKSVTRYQQTKIRNFTEGKIPDPMCKVEDNESVVVNWAENGVMITFSPTGGRNMCDLTVETFQSGVLLGPVNFDLVSLSRRRDAVSVLRNRQKGDDWDAILDVACRVAKNAREDDADFIDTSVTKIQVNPNRWLIDGLLPLKKPTILFATGGTGKSFFGTAISMAVSSMIEVIEGFEPLDTGQVLYLDWETDEEEFTWRKQALINCLNNRGVSGGDLEESDFPVSYRRCTDSLVALQPRLRKWLDSNSCPLIVIDSLIPALDADANDSETARRFMNIVRSFDTTVLVLSHTSKEGKLFGSTFWWNLARNVWSVSKEQDMGESYTDIAFTHEKSNNSRLYPPIGLRFSHENNIASFERIETSELSNNIAKSIPIKVRIRELLKTGRLMSSKEIAEELDATVEAVGMALNRGKSTSFSEIHDPVGNRKWRIIN